MEEGGEEREEEGSSSDLLHPLSSFRAIGRRIEATTRIHVHWASFRSLEASSFFSFSLSLSLSGLALAEASAASLIWLSSRSNRADRRTKRPAARRRSSFGMKRERERE